MKQTCRFVRNVCSLVAIFASTVNTKLILIEDADHLSSSHPEINYPNNNETLDVIWLFDHSIRLHLDEFHLNGHSGDFVLISEQPLIDPDYFKEKNGTGDDSYQDVLAKNIVTDQGLLLSWKVTKTFEAVNNRGGTFVLFHSEAKDPAGTANFKGFDIRVVNYDDSITTTTSTTPDPYVPPKEVEHYITKFLNCKEPRTFFRELDDFKEKIAQIATKFCKESDIPYCLDRGDISKEDINIPGPNQGTYAGLHYCDRTWESYNRCVEVTFAIIRTDNEGNYVLPKSRLEKMWEAKSYELVQYGYCPYDPPEAKIDINTVMWIAFFLGIILGLTIFLAAAWIKNTRSILEYRKSFMKDDASSEDQKKINDDKPQKHYDERNPIYNFIPKSHDRDDHLYPNSDYLHVNGGEGATSPGPFKKRSTENPTFQNAEADVYAFDNTGFEEEENNSTRGRNDGETLVMRSRTSHSSLSDTEI